MQHLFGHADDALFGTVGAQVHSAQDVCLSAFEFALVESVLQETASLIQRKVECCFQLVRLGSQGYAPVGAVAVNVGGGIHGVGEAFIFANLLE